MLDGSSTTAFGEGFDDLEFRRAMSCFPSGVVALCGFDGDEPVGMAVGSFTSVSLAPPLVSVCVAHTSTTWPRLRSLTALGLSVLSAAQAEMSRMLSARGVDRFGQVDWRRLPSGAVVVEGTALTLDCRIESVIRAGDHDVVILEVKTFNYDVGIAPLIFYGSEFRELSRRT
ncbi:flavin reductase family protein [Actinomadura madurae]|uniref:flavin reductase family protein n=1 Tax=Actinomadura madurae TaxID=1993 RepID=UPI00399B9F91